MLYGRFSGDVLVVREALKTTLTFRVPRAEPEAAVLSTALSIR